MTQSQPKIFITFQSELTNKNNFGQHVEFEKETDHKNTYVLWTSTTTNMASMRNYDVCDVFNVDRNYTEVTK